MANTYETTKITLNKGDYLVVDLQNRIVRKRKTITIPFQVESPGSETNLQDLGEGLTQTILSERLVPFTHITTNYNRMAIKIYPHDRHNPKTLSNSKNYL